MLIVLTNLGKQFDMTVVIHLISLSSSIKLTGDDGDVLFDYSKNVITEKTLELLFKLVISLNYLYITYQTTCISTAALNFGCAMCGLVSLVCLAYHVYLLIA